MFTNKCLIIKRDNALHLNIHMYEESNNSKKMFLTYIQNPSFDLLDIISTIQK